MFFSFSQRWHKIYKISPLHHAAGFCFFFYILTHNPSSHSPPPWLFWLLIRSVAVTFIYSSVTFIAASHRNVAPLRPLLSARVLWVECWRGRAHKKTLRFWCDSHWKHAAATSQLWSARRFDEKLKKYFHCQNLWICDILGLPEKNVDYEILSQPLIHLILASVLLIVVSAPPPGVAVTP